jgi:hypothetical protein
MKSHLNHQQGLDLSTLKLKTFAFAILLRMLLPQESREPVEKKKQQNHATLTL